MSSHGMSLNAESEGSRMSISWFVGVLVLKPSAALCCAGCAVGAAVVGVVVVALCMLCASCLMASQVSSGALIGMSGHVVLKQRGWYDEPWLCVSRTRHSRPCKLVLQIGQVEVL